MKKIIAAFDGLKYSESTAAAAIAIASKYHAMLVGVFLEDFTYHSYKIADIMGKDSVEEKRSAQLNELDRETRERSILHFRSTCSAAGVGYSTHRDRNIAIQELLKESLYADLLIIQNNETLTHFTEDIPTRFISNLLERAECPVLLVPPVYAEPEKFVFLYNGEPSSVFAIKQFASVFSDRKMPIELLCVKKNKGDTVLPDNRLIREWVNLHFENVQYHMLHGHPEEEIMKYLKEQVRYAAVVMGAYERGNISRFLRASMADEIMKFLDIPVFVAHK